MDIQEKKVIQSDLDVPRESIYNFNDDEIDYFNNRQDAKVSKLFENKCNANYKVIDNQFTNLDRLETNLCKTTPNDFKHSIISILNESSQNNNYKPDTLTLPLNTVSYTSLYSQCNISDSEICKNKPQLFDTSCGTGQTLVTPITISNGLKYPLYNYPINNIKDINNFSLPSLPSNFDQNFNVFLNERLNGPNPTNSKQTLFNFDPLNFKYDWLKSNSFSKNIINESPLKTNVEFYSTNHNSFCSSFRKSSSGGDGSQSEKPTKKRGSKIQFFNDWRLERDKCGRFTKHNNYTSHRKQLLEKLRNGVTLQCQLCGQTFHSLKGYIDHESKLPCLKRSVNAQSGKKRGRPRKLNQSNGINYGNGSTSVLGKTYQERKETCKTYTKTSQHCDSNKYENPFTLSGAFNWPGYGLSPFANSKSIFPYFDGQVGGFTKNGLKTKIHNSDLNMAMNNILPKPTATPNGLNNLEPITNGKKCSSLEISNDSKPLWPAPNESNWNYHNLFLLNKLQPNIFGSPLFNPSWFAMFMNSHNDYIRKSIEFYRSKLQTTNNNNNQNLNCINNITAFHFSEPIIYNNVSYSINNKVSL